jgi:hypothetical protein
MHSLIQHDYYLQTCHIARDVTNPEVRHIGDIDFVFTKITCVPLLALGI